jgi:hypothetical protein
MSDDYFQRGGQVARVNPNGEPIGDTSLRDDDYFQRDGRAARVKRDRDTPGNANDDYFRRDDSVAHVQDESEPDGEPATLRDTIRDNAMGPKKVTGDAGSVEQHSLRDQIEAERFLASKEATKRPGLGIRFTKLVPDGTT